MAATPEEIAEIRDEVSRFFDARYNIKFVRSIGEGNHGGTALYHEEAKDRNLVVKFSLAPGEDDHLENELVWVPRFRNFEHFIQHIALDQAAMGPGRGGLPRRPVMVLEYLRHGNLWEFGERFRKTRRFIPNRLLWRFCLCLTRMAIGMAYHDKLPGANQNPSGREVRETIPANEFATSLAQLSMKGENVLVGDLFPIDIPEHNLSPLAKIIDFGRAKLVEPETDELYADWNEGVGYNIWGIGKIMQDLACNLTAHSITWDPVKVSRAQYDTPNGSRIRFRSEAHRSLGNNMTVDPVLKILIYQLLATDRANTPSLDDLLEICERKVAKQTAADYAVTFARDGIAEPESPFETDEAIRAMLERTILSADDEPLPPEDMMEDMENMMVSFSLGW